jgi:single-strand DNA-binding protein
MSFCKALILGRLGRDPELKHLPTGNAVCNFSIATSETYTDKHGERKESTSWHNIVAYGKVAELCAQYLKKGSQAFVDGKIQTRSYEKDGEKRYVTEIIANSVQFLDGKEKQEEKPAKDDKANYVDIDSIPF